MEEDLSITPYIMRTNVKSLRTMVIRANILVYLENSVDSFESLQENVLSSKGSRLRQYHRAFLER